MQIFNMMSKNARTFRTTVDISLQQFDFFVRCIEKTYPEAELKMFDRATGARSTRVARSPCTCGGMVFLILMYYRTCLIQDGIAHLFGISYSDAPK